MKIRTIVGILLVFALVLGSTGIAAAECVPTGDGPYNGEPGPHPSEDCEPTGDGPYNGEPGPHPSEDCEPTGDGPFGPK